MTINEAKTAGYSARVLDGDGDGNETKLDTMLRKNKARIISHMNTDHAMSVLAYAHMWFDKSAIAATMTGLNSKGFLLRVTMPCNTLHENVFIKYTSELTNAGGVRKIAVEMHYEAFQTLGKWYKLTMGYYNHKVLFGMKHLRPFMLVGGSLLFTMIAIAYGTLCWRSRNIT